MSKLKEFGYISLVDVLNSTLQIPYEAIILVDDSSDGTREVFKEWCARHSKELIVSSSRIYGYNRPTRATARQTAIDMFFENFSNEFLMFIDDDCILRDGWWKWVKENKVLEDPSVGEVWGINWDATPERERFLRFFNTNLRDYLIRKFNERGGTHDTIYRNDAIKGIIIPPGLHIYEDAYLHKWVIDHGWRSMINPVGVLHYHPMTTNLKSEMETLRIAMYAAKKYGIVEYETAKLLSLSQEEALKRFFAYFSMIRPILGLPLMLLATTSTFGLKRGIKEAFVRQYLKLWFRWQMLKSVKETRKVQFHNAAWTDHGINDGIT